MLRGLYIRNLLLIDRLDLDFQPGLNVLTGETGAGKSILLDSLGFALGWRGRADLVRSGASQGEVTAVFEVPAQHPISAIVQMHDLRLNDGEMILRRTNSPDGRKMAFLNDVRISGDVLRTISDHLVELHGQHDDRGLLNTRGHRALLDAFAGTNLEPVRKIWVSMRDTQKNLDRERAAFDAARVDMDFLHHALEELEKLAPKPGEDAELDARRRLMQSSARISEDIGRAANALGPESAERAIVDALRWLEGVAELSGDLLKKPVAALSQLASELADVQRSVEDCLVELEFNPLELEAAEERLFAIRALSRKHGVQPDGLAGLGNELRARLVAIDTGAEQIKTLEKMLTAARQDYAASAKKLTDGRKNAASRLDKLMRSELAPLRMENAVFTTEVSKSEAGPDGCDLVAFTVVTNPGAPPGPISKIASGGELSRFLLALKVCLTKRSEGMTLIFDEIDRGVGGATADAVGRRLAVLAQNAQILVVTHSPQVAAQGDHQWKVSKSVTNDETLSAVVKLNGNERRLEIARMLAGDVITPEAKAAAKALLAR